MFSLLSSLPHPPPPSPPPTSSFSFLCYQSKKSDSSMEISTKQQKNLSNNSFSSNSNGIQVQALASPQVPQPPKPITKSEQVNSYPTTFVQADTSSFKQVVQMLTGSSETAKQVSSKPTSNSIRSDPPSKTHIPPIKSMPKKQQSEFKLYERRNSFKNFKINPLSPDFASKNSGFSPRKPEILSPSILDFPSLSLSPVTPLIPDPFDRSGLTSFTCSNNGNGSANLDKDAEERAIKEKGFYLHPSPNTTPRDPEPRLLSLFPTTSPRSSSGSASST